MKKSKLVVLVPSLLDSHFPLLEVAFTSKNYDIVMLKNDKNLEKIGLQYIHNDICYPLVLIVGQMIDTLKNNIYDLNNIVFLIGQAGDGCRGSNYIHLMKRALKIAGYDIPVISLNFTNLEKDNRFKLDLTMLFKAIVSIMYSDLIMILKNQIEPYEITLGETQKKYNYWIELLKQEISKLRVISKERLREKFIQIINDFKTINCDYSKHIQKIGLVGELYVKYCHIGNWNIQDFLKQQNCEIMVNGFSWYILYYIDTHLKESASAERYLYSVAKSYFESIQSVMIEEVKNNNFKILDVYSTFKDNASRYMDLNCTIGDGWLIGAEVSNLILNGYNKILGVQPFGCMPNHVSGRGLYTSLKRKFNNSQIVSIDYDASGTDINIKNRIRMLLDID